MSYYWFNREEFLRKSKEKYDDKAGKEKASKYYENNKETINEKGRNKHKNLTEKEKKLKRQYSKNR